MAPSRLQCLNSVRTVTRKVPSLKAGFSTSRSVRADEPPKPSSHFDDIDNLASPQSSSPLSSSLRQQFSPARQENVPLHERKPQPGNQQSTQRLSGLLRNSVAIRKQREAEASFELAPKDSKTTTGEEDLTNHHLAAGLSRQITRRFQAGDVYAPHDLSSVEMQKWRTRGRPSSDAFDALDLKPLDHYRNFSMISEYMTPMGRIKHSSQTGLRPVNQRRIARTIRRAIGMGLVPSVHRHPEILQKVLQKKSTPNRVI